MSINRTTDKELYNHTVAYHTAVKINFLKVIKCPYKQLSFIMLARKDADNTGNKDTPMGNKHVYVTQHHLRKEKNM